MNKLVCRPGVLRQARAERGWAQIDLAAAAGLSRRTVARAEAGSGISARAAHDLAAALGVAVDAVIADRRVCAQLPAPVPQEVPRAPLQAAARAHLRAHKVVALTGPAGVGKTVLAAALGRAVQFDVERLVWADANDGLSGIAAQLGVSDPASSTAPQVGEQLWAEPTLLVVDGVVTPHRWRGLLAGARGAVVLTSRLRLKGVPRVVLPGFTPAEVQAHLGAPDWARSAIARLNPYVGGLPVAWSWVRQAGHAALADLDRRLRDPSEVPPFLDCDPLNQCFQSSFDGLGDSGVERVARRILRALGTADAAALPLAGLRAAVGPIDDFVLHRAVATLTGQSLVHRHGGLVGVSPAFRQWLAVDPGGL